MKVRAVKCDVSIKNKGFKEYIVYGELLKLNNLAFIVDWEHKKLTQIYPNSIRPFVIEINGREIYKGDCGYIEVQGKKSSDKIRVKVDEIKDNVVKCVHTTTQKRLKIDVDTFKQGFSPCAEELEMDGMSAFDETAFNAMYNKYVYTLANVLFTRSQKATLFEDEMFNYSLMLDDRNIPRELLLFGRYGTLYMNKDQLRTIIQVLQDTYDVYFRDNNPYTWSCFNKEAYNIDKGGNFKKYRELC